MVIDTPLPGDLIVDTVRIDRDRVALDVHRTSAPNTGGSGAGVAARQEARPGDPLSASFDIRTTLAPTSPKQLRWPAT